MGGTYQGSHYLLVNNDRGSHYLLVKNDRGVGGGVIFSGESFFTATPELCYQMARAFSFICMRCFQRSKQCREWRLVNKCTNGF